MVITENMKTKMSLLRKEIFEIPYNKKVVAISEDCNNQNLFRAVMLLQEQTYLKDMANEILIDVINNNDITKEEPDFLVNVINSIK